MGKRIFLAAVGAMVFLFLVFVAWKQTRPSEEAIAIQTIVEDLPAYQDEIESWGYQVSVFDPVRDEHKDTDEIELLPHALLHYERGTYHPVLILTDQTAGIWFFYQGFDQYVQETIRPELVTLYHDEEKLMDVSMMLWLQKDSKKRILSEFNYAKRGKRSYYDMEATLYIMGIEPETQERVNIINGGFCSTQYCSNNFEECKRFSGIDPESANRFANMQLKKRYTAEELLEIYRQGIDLQDRLVELSCRE